MLKNFQYFVIASVREEDLPLPYGPSSWTENEIDMRQINMRKSNKVYNMLIHMKQTLENCITPQNGQRHHLK